jgi:hypothetical protein
VLIIKEFSRVTKKNQPRINEWFSIFFKKNFRTMAIWQKRNDRLTQLDTFVNIQIDLHSINLLLQDVVQSIVPETNLGL